MQHAAISAKRIEVIHIICHSYIRYNISISFARVGQCIHESQLVFLLEPTLRITRCIPCHRCLPMIQIHTYPPWCTNHYVTCLNTMRIGILLPLHENKLLIQIIDSLHISRCVYRWWDGWDRNPTARGSSIDTSA